MGQTDNARSFELVAGEAKVLGEFRQKLKNNSSR